MCVKEVQYRCESMHGMVFLECINLQRMIHQSVLYTMFQNFFLLTVMYIPVRPSRRESDEDELDE